MGCQFFATTALTSGSRVLFLPPAFLSRLLRQAVIQFSGLAPVTIPAVTNRFSQLQPLL